MLYLNCFIKSGDVIEFEVFSGLCRKGPRSCDYAWPWSRACVRQKYKPMELQLLESASNYNMHCVLNFSNVVMSSMETFSLDWKGSKIARRCTILKVLLPDSETMDLVFRVRRTLGWNLDSIIHDSKKNIAFRSSVAGEVEASERVICGFE